MAIRIDPLAAGELEVEAGADELVPLAGVLEVEAGDDELLEQPPIAAAVTRATATPPATMRAR